jgi:hypothetical protein
MHWKQWLAARLGLAVTAVPVGQPGDGLVAWGAAGRIDKPWAELAQEFEDAREAWRKNPLARRLVGLTTAYTVGNGITLQSDYRPLARFVREFWLHNRMDLRVGEWSDELARSGELFLVLFTNPVSGLSSVRSVPACRIEEVEFDPDDYERELRYREQNGPGLEGKWWLGVGSVTADYRLLTADRPLGRAVLGPHQNQRAGASEAGAENHGLRHHESTVTSQRSAVESPLMLHYAVNRPIGAVRGESDLAPILPWLRRYSRWLEDRVRLNAAMRAFLWIVHAPGRLRATLEERYRTPPEAGSVIIAEQDAESWEAVAPTLHAADAEKDGRAIRWMIVAGGPGTSLLDLGEGEDSNLATGRTMAELRRRFLRRRQTYLAWMLCDLVVHAFGRWATATGHRGRTITHADLIALTPDISPEDNQELAAAAAQLTGSLDTLAGLVGEGPAYRRMALRLFGKFVGESLGDREFEAILQEGNLHEQHHERHPEQHADKQHDLAGDHERTLGGATGDLPTVGGGSGGPSGAAAFTPPTPGGRVNGTHLRRSGLPDRP